jgi:hypothetical protein
MAGSFLNWAFIREIFSFKVECPQKCLWNLLNYGNDIIKYFTHSISCLLIICSNSNIIIKNLKFLNVYKIHSSIFCTIYCVQNTKINRTKKNDVETIIILFFMCKLLCQEKIIFVCVQKTIYCVQNQYSHL